MSETQTHAVNLLPLARANGVRGTVRGLTAFVASYTPIPARTKRWIPGSELTVEVAGRELDYESRARLLAFAEQHVEADSASRSRSRPQAREPGIARQ
jgi:hypothetical protein